MTYRERNPIHLLVEIEVEYGICAHGDHLNFIYKPRVDPGFVQVDGDDSVVRMKVNRDHPPGFIKVVTPPPPGTRLEHREELQTLSMN